ncbi:MAG: tetratricopeptide repeat protein, partial [Cyclobacteriaceae bacterium]|nr:tetratricopeptide repeat protein [Cyclobacteriaceae bacterium]
MKSTVWLATFLFLAVSQAVFAQSWREKYNQAADLYSQEKYNEAAALAEESLNGYLAEGATSGDNHASILRLLATISFSRQDFRKGLDYANQEIQLRETKKDTVLAIALVNRALFQEQLGQLGQALQSLTEAHNLFLASYPANHNAVLECRMGIGTIYYLMNDLVKAREWLYPALEASDQKGEYTQEILEGFYYAGMVDLESAEAKDALNRFEKAGELYRSASLQQSLDYALVLYGKGLAQHQLRMYEQADATLALSQSAYEGMAGKSGEEYFAIIRARVQNAHSWGKPELANDWTSWLRANPEARTAYGEMNTSLGYYYHGRGDLSKAEAYYREALVAFGANEKSDALRRAEASLNLAVLLADQGKVEEALTRVSESLGLIESIGGKESVLYRRAQIRMGATLIQAGKWQAAQSTLEEVSRTMTTLPPAEQSSLLNSLGEVAWRNGRYRRADSLYNAVLYPYEKEGKTPDRYYATALNNLAASRQAEGRFSETLTLSRRSATVTRQLFGAGSLAYAGALENEALLRMRLGDLLASKGRLDSAVLLY